MITLYTLCRTDITKRILTRFAKRINYGWTLANNQNNIEIATELLDKINPQKYSSSKAKREGYICLAHLMKFLMNIQYDLKTFVSTKQKYFTDLLNHVANHKRLTERFDSNECKKIMEYCGVQYKKWEK